MNVDINYEKDLEEVRSGKYLSANKFIKLCRMTRELLTEESFVVQVQSPVVICGDTQGQFFDFLEIFKTTGNPPETKYLFLGDYINQGYHGVEIFTFLMLLKCQHPDKIIMLRGSDECSQISQIYGFYDEVLSKYENTFCYTEAIKTFNLLPYCAIVDNVILCVHGGLSPNCISIDELHMTPSVEKETPHEGPACDIIWSNPNEEQDQPWVPVPKGYQFGEKALTKFFFSNKLDCMARSHQLVMEGHKSMFGDRLLTVWSAPNYCHRCGNEGCVLHLDDKCNKQYFPFKASEETTKFFENPFPILTNPLVTSTSHPK